MKLAAGVHVLSVSNIKPKPLHPHFTGTSCLSDRKILQDTHSHLQPHHTKHMIARPTAFQGPCYPIHRPLSGSQSTSNRCAFRKPRMTRKSRYVNGLRGLRASRKRRSTVKDEAFSTCTSCGSDEIVSASKILERGRITVKCTQCGTRFTATAKEALTITGTPLRERVETMKEEQSEEDPNTVDVKLYLSGLPPRIDSAGLRRAVEEFGEVTDSRVVVDRVTGRSRGFGFVTVRGRSTAAAVIDILNGESKRFGSRLTVREAIE